jgi:hypothetical protein
MAQNRTGLIECAIRYCFGFGRPDRFCSLPWPADAGARLGLARRRTRSARGRHGALRPALRRFVSRGTVVPGQERAPEQSWRRRMARLVDPASNEADCHYQSPSAAPRTGRCPPPVTPADARHRSDAPLYRHVRRGPERKTSHIFGQLTAYELSRGLCDSASLPFEFRTNTYVSRQARLITSKSSYSAYAPFHWPTGGAATGRTTGKIAGMPFATTITAAAAMSTRSAVSVWASGPAMP